MKKKRFIVLAVVIFLILAVTAITVIKNGNRFTLRFSHNHFGDWIKTDDYPIELFIEDESVVKAEKVYFDKDYIVCLDLVAVGKGETDIDVKVGGVMLEHTGVKVTAFNFIVEKFHLNFNGFHTVEYIILACLALVSAVMAYTYFECRKKGRFSYSMVAYGGAGLFSAAIVVYALYYMRTFDDFRFMLNTMSETGYYFVVVAAPVMMLLSGLCAFSNIWLVRHEGFRTANLLGIILAALCFLGSVVIIVGRSSDYAVFNKEAHNTIFLASAYIVSFLECVFMFTMLTAFLSTRHYPSFDKDYIIILGCRIRKDGSLTPLLKGRVDAAIKFEKEQFEKTGRHAKFVPSGGQGSDEVISESEAMKNYLVQNGIPASQILPDDASTNTWQNIKFSRDVIWQDSGDKKSKAAFSTTNYHVFRGYVLSREHGLDAEGISAKTKWYFYPNAFLREFAGLLVSKRIKLAIAAAVVFVCSVLVHLALL